MSVFEFDVETCSEKYKEHIRCINYGDSISTTTKESMIFIHKDKKYTIKFSLEFAFDYENGFCYTNFSDFTSSRKIMPELMAEFVNYIKGHFVTSDRLSC